MPEFMVATEICEGMWVPHPPSIRHALTRATVVMNCSASDETADKDTYRHDLMCSQLARLICGYVYTSAGEEESTRDLVSGSQNIIAEDRTCLAGSRRFINESICTSINLERLDSEHRRMSTFPDPAAAKKEGGYLAVGFSLDAVSEDSPGGQNTQAAGSSQPGDDMLQYVGPAPSVLRDERQKDRCCEEILSIRTMDLRKHLERTGCCGAMIGLSGGPDSMLALLVTVRAFDSLKIPRSGIHYIAIPCFGVTGRTHNNICILAGRVGTEPCEVSIKKAMTHHFEDIGHGMDRYGVTYGNGQAKERTQALMGIVNEVEGLVAGTGDMSEPALGWTICNGDYMSIYGVDESVPKILVHRLVRCCMDICREKELVDMLFDVLGIPVNPEPLSPQDGRISQKTEDLAGPYELCDFYLYYILRYGYAPSEIHYLVFQVFKSQYDREATLKQINVFRKRFFNQQFKRSCLPGGLEVGSMAVSPRGDLRVPNGASGRLWLEELGGTKQAMSRERIQMINGTSNRQVKHVTSLRNKAKTRWEEGTCVVEDFRMCRELNPEDVDAPYVTESFVGNRDSRKWIEWSWPETISDAAMNVMVDTRTPQGVLAVVRQRRYTMDNIVRSASGVRPLAIMVLETVQDPGNLGAITRAGEGTGITGAVMDHTTADLYNPEVIHSTTGSIYRVPFAYTADLQDACLLMEKKGVHLFTIHLKGMNNCDQEDYTDNAGFLTGNEVSDPAEETASLTDYLMEIPMEGKMRSLNTVVTASTLMFKTTGQKKSCRQ